MAAVPALDDQIAGLSAAQAQQAILAFYNALPADLWPGQRKWPLSDFRVRASLVEAESPDNVKPVLQELISPENPEAKGELSRAVLLALAGEEPVRRYVAEAVEEAQEPDMLPIPLIIGAVLVFIAIIPGHIKTKNIEIDFPNGQAIVNAIVSLAPSLNKLIGK
jgi:hypothetical protein